MRGALVLKILLSTEERDAFAGRAAVEGLSLEDWLKQTARERLATPCGEEPEARAKRLLEMFEPLRELESELSLDPTLKKDADSERSIEGVNARQETGG